MKKHYVNITYTKTQVKATCEACDWFCWMPRYGNNQETDKFQRQCFAHIGMPVKKQEQVDALVRKYKGHNAVEAEYEARPGLKGFRLSDGSCLQVNVETGEVHKQNYGSHSWRKVNKNFFKKEHEKWDSSHKHEQR